MICTNMPLRIRLFRLSSWFLRTFRGYSTCLDSPYRNIPKIGEVCWVPYSPLRVREAILKERIAEHRPDLDSFRYYFEDIYGCELNIYNGIIYKSTGQFAWEDDPRNPKNKGKND